MKAAENLRKNFGIEDQIEVHGLIDGGRPAIYPSDGNFRKLTVGQASVLLSDTSGVFGAFLLEGAGFPNSKVVIQDEKLQPALDLYSAYFTEVSDNARFLTLVMALETLAQSNIRPQLVLKLLDKFKEQVEELEITVQPETAEAVSLESLKKELIFRREDSLRSQIRSLVHQTLSSNGDPDAVDIARKATQLYDKRSRLVHNGSLPRKELGTGCSDAQRIVKRVLIARFLRVAKEKPNT